MSKTVFLTQNGTGNGAGQADARCKDPCRKTEPPKKDKTDKSRRNAMERKIKEVRFISNITGEKETGK